MTNQVLAVLISNVLGAGEMLSGPNMDSARIIEKILDNPEEYRELIDPIPPMPKKRWRNCR